MKKRQIALALAFLLVAAAFPATSLGAVWTAYVYTSNGKGLNLRPEPSTEADPIATIPYGEQVRVSGYVNEWAEVYYGNLHGYVMDRYLIAQPAPAPVPTYNPRPASTKKPASESSSLKEIFHGFVYVDYLVQVRPSTPGGFVHMRWAPTKAADPMHDFHQNDEMRVIAQNTNWAQVVDPQTGATGFMMRSFLKDSRVWETIGTVGSP